MPCAFEMRPIVFPRLAHVTASVMWSEFELAQSLFFFATLKSDQGGGGGLSQEKTFFDDYFPLFSSTIL